MNTVSEPRFRLTKAISEAVDRHGEEYKQLAAQPYNIWFDPSVRLRLEITESIETVLASEPEFCDQRPKYLRYGNSISIVQESELARVLFSIAVEQDTQAAISWLNKILRIRSSPVLQIMTLFGITVDKSVSLTENVDIMPFAELPNSPQKAALQPLPLGQYLQMPIMSRPLFDARPPTALVARTVTEPLLLNSDQVDQAKFDHYLEDHTQLEDICMCLTVCDNISLSPSMEWCQFQDDYLNRIGGIAIQHFDRVHVLTNPNLLNLNSAKLLVPNYLEMSGHDKDKLRIALTKLNSSMQRKNIEEKAIDLGTALEVLLTGSEGNQNEITWRLGFRAAWVCGNNVQTRGEVRKRIINAYSLRSRAVHSGKINNTKDNLQTIDSATSICAKLVRKFITEQAIPNWSEFEISDK